MSIDVSRRVWDGSQQSGAAFTVLLALADYADDEGVAFPGIDALARKARLSERTTQYAIKQLQDSGEVVVERGGGRHRTHRYIVAVPETVQTVHPLPDDDAPKTVQPVRGNGDETVQHLHPSEPETVQSATERVQTTAGNGAASAPEPSLTIKKSSKLRNDQRKDDVEEVYAYYRERIFPGSRTPAPDKIRARLKTFTVEELKRGIDNFAASPWSMRKNGKRGCAWFFANDGRSEMYLHMQPDGADDGRANGRADHEAAPGPTSESESTAALTPATDDDLAIWARALDELRGGMSEGNFATYVAPLDVAGRDDAGGLCLVVPSGIGEGVARMRQHIRRALLDAGDAAPEAVAFKVRRGGRGQDGGA